MDKLTFKEIDSLFLEGFPNLGKIKFVGKIIDPGEEGYIISFGVKIYGYSFLITIGDEYFSTVGIETKEKAEELRQRFIETINF